jgi:hypothetical protein
VKIENWSLAIENHCSIAICKSSIFNSQSPSKARFLSATPVMVEWRRILGTCFCTAQSEAVVASYLPSLDSIGKTK